MPGFACKPKARAEGLDQSPGHERPRRIRKRFAFDAVLETRVDVGIPT